MSELSMNTAGQRPVVGSLSGVDHAAFGDERERRIWMESYVIAFEVAILAAFGVAAVMAWVGDQTVARWSIGVVAIIGAGNMAALAHLRRHGVSDIRWRDRWTFWSFRLRILLAAIWGLGLVITILGEGGSLAERGGWSYVAGLVVGATVALAGFWFADRQTKRRAQAELPEDDTFSER